MSVSKGPEIASANCDKSPQPIFDGHLDQGMDELSFDVPMAEGPVLSVGTFKGALKGGTLTGT